MDAQFASPVAEDRTVGIKVTKIEIYPELKTFRVEYDYVHASGARRRAHVIALAGESDAVRFDRVMVGAGIDVMNVLAALTDVGELPGLTAPKSAAPVASPLAP